MSNGKLEAPRGSRADGEFIAKLGHELRTPLTAILGYTEILKQRAIAHLPADLYHQLEIVERSGQAMLRLIAAVVDWSRLEAGQVEVEARAFRVEETLHDFAETLVIMAAAKGLAFEIKLAPGHDAVFTTDPYLLRQVFTNLVTNAVKYTEHGGISVEADCREGSLTLTVADTGPGIPAAYHELVFEEFQRLHQRSREGTGLGLAITRGLVDLLGGRIRLESQPGAGARFTVVLPALTPATGGEAEPPLPFPAATRPAAIAVFDDEPDNRELLRSFLEHAGMRVTTHESAADCVMQTLADPPDLIVLDLMMPEVDGFEAARRLRACEATRHVPIIGLTALAGDDAGAHAVAAGCNLCLTKPVDFRKLTLALQQCLAVVRESAK